MIVPLEELLDAPNESTELHSIPRFGFCYDKDPVR